MSPAEKREHDQMQARIAILEEGLLAAYELVTDTVPSEPRGLEDWYMENLAEAVEEIKARRPHLVAKRPM